MVGIAVGALKTGQKKSKIYSQNVRVLLSKLVTCCNQYEFNSGTRFGLRRSVKKLTNFSKNKVTKIEKRARSKSYPLFDFGTEF